MGCTHFQRSGALGSQDAEILVGVVTSHLANKMVTQVHHPFLHERLVDAGLNQSILVEYFSDFPILGLPSWNDNSTESSYGVAANRFLATLQHAFSDCLPYPNLKWFMLIDDDVVFDPTRLAAFVSEVGKLGKNPSTDPMVFGRETTWCGWCGFFELFGGNGWLISSAALRLLREHAGRDWSRIMDGRWDGPVWFEHRVFWLLHNVATPWPELDMFHAMSPPFGIGTHVSDNQNQLGDVQERLHNASETGALSNQPPAYAAFTLHKVKTPQDAVLAAEIFGNNVSCPTVDCASSYRSALQASFKQRIV
jgi:hypothetical protein